MSTKAASPPSAWEPVTPRGVAAFARAPLWRLWLAQLVVALLAAAATGWFLDEEWFPVVRTAIRQLPEQGEIRDQRLDWHGGSPVKLGGNQFLGLSVDLDHSGGLAEDAQIQVEFGRRNLHIILPPGPLVLEYPAGWRIAFNRAELAPLWGAWEPMLTAGAVALTAAGLLVIWGLLAAVYCVPVRLITLYANRDLTLGQSWRLSGAALMPGALFLTFGLVVYGLGSMALAQLGVVWALHLVMGWIYLFVSQLFLPREPSATAARGNPFARDREPRKR